MNEPFDILIVGGTVVTPEAAVRTDIGIRNGLICAIGDLTHAVASQTLDAKGLTILPGVIDTQVHFREPGLTQKEDIESGSRAAVMGGVTTYFEMPNTNPATITESALQDKLDRARERSWANYAFFVGASPENVHELSRLELLPGTPGVKIFHGSSTGSLLVETEDALRAVLQSGKLRCPIHSEDEPRLRARKSLASVNDHVRMHPLIRDAEAAVIATRRCIRLSKETGRPIHILHVSTADELEIIADAKQQGIDVTCEVTPQHLTLDDAWYETHGANVQMNPPIRSRAHREAIRAALQNGLFDVIGSDHAPHTREEKSQPYPNSPSGIPGVQTLLPIMLTLVKEGLLSLSTLVKLASANPAKLYGVANKGQIQVGFDADLVILNPDEPFVVESDWLQSKCGWSPWEGQHLLGKPRHVLVKGAVTVQDSKLTKSRNGQQVQFIRG